MIKTEILGGIIYESDEEEWTERNWLVLMISEWDFEWVSDVQSGSVIHTHISSLF